MFDNRVTFILGDSGSGKTELARQVVAEHVRAGFNSALVDLNFGRPLCSYPLETASPPPDAPCSRHQARDPGSLVTCLRQLLLAPNVRVVVDTAADPSCWRAVGECVEALPARVMDRLLVVNFLRPLTRDVAGAVEFARDVQRAIGAPLTAIVGNTHLMEETTAELTLQGAGQAIVLAKQLGMPVAGIAAREPLASTLGGAVGAPIIRLGSPAVPPTRREVKKAPQAAVSPSVGGAACHRS